MRPAIAVPIPAAAGPVACCSTPARTPTRGPSTCSSSRTWARSSREEILDVERARGAAALDRRGGREGQPADARGARLLREDDGINFAGNAESRDLLRGAADVVVTDGFTGNIALKLLEGTISELLDALRDEITATRAGKLGGLLIRPAARRLRTRLDPDTYGGAYLLGLRGLAVIAHGNSGRTAIANAIRLAARGAEHRVVERLAERLPERVACMIAAVFAAAYYRRALPTPRQSR